MLVHTEFVASWTQSSQSSTSEDTERKSAHNIQAVSLPPVHTPSCATAMLGMRPGRPVFCFLNMQVWKVSSIPNQEKRENWLPEQLELFKT